MKLAPPSEPQEFEEVGTPVARPGKNAENSSILSFGSEDVGPTTTGTYLAPPAVITDPETKNTEKGNNTVETLNVTGQSEKNDTTSIDNLYLDKEMVANSTKFMDSFDQASNKFEQNTKAVNDSDTSDTTVTLDSGKLANSEEEMQTNYSDNLDNMFSDVEAAENAHKIPTFEEVLNKLSRNQTVSVTKVEKGNVDKDSKNTSRADNSTAELNKQSSENNSHFEKAILTNISTPQNKTNGTVNMRKEGTGEKNAVKQQQLVKAGQTGTQSLDNKQKPHTEEKQKEGNEESRKVERKMSNNQVNDNKNKVENNGNVEQKVKENEKVENKLTSDSIQNAENKENEANKQKTEENVKTQNNEQSENNVKADDELTSEQQAQQFGKTENMTSESLPGFHGSPADTTYFVDNTTNNENDDFKELYKDNDNDAFSFGLEPSPAPGLTSSSSSSSFTSGNDTSKNGKGNTADSGIKDKQASTLEGQSGIDYSHNENRNISFDKELNRIDEELQSTIKHLSQRNDSVASDKVATNNASNTTENVTVSQVPKENESKQFLNKTKKPKYQNDVLFVDHQNKYADPDDAMFSNIEDERASMDANTELQGVNVGDSNLVHMPDNSNRPIHLQDTTSNEYVEGDDKGTLGVGEVASDANEGRDSPVVTTDDQYDSLVGDEEVLAERALESKKKQINRLLQELNSKKKHRRRRRKGLGMSYTKFGKPLIRHHAIIYHGQPPRDDYESNQEYRDDDGVSEESDHASLNEDETDNVENVKYKMQMLHNPAVKEQIFPGRRRHLNQKLDQKRGNKFSLIRVNYTL